MPEWLLFALAVCASVGFWSFVLFCFNRKAKREWRELEKLRDERAGHSLETFQEHFAKRQVPPEVSAAVYQYLQAYASVPAFPVLPQDRLERLYGVADDETPALLDALLLRLGRKWTDIKTVEDVVLLLAQQSEKKVRGSPTRTSSS